MSEKLAAIDVGSNAIRMVLAETQGATVLFGKKFRIPIRLGEDVFQSGKISGKNLKASARTFKKFAELCKKNGIKKIRAVGTSALRESKNKESFVELIWRKSGIRLEVIDGIEEGRLVYLAISRELDLTSMSSLLIDIGGGSVELSLSHKGRLTATQSFPFGTVRTLAHLKQRKMTEKDLPQLVAQNLEPLSQFLAAQNRQQNLDCAIGTGGNIEALGKLKAHFVSSSSKSWLQLEDLDKIIEGLRKQSLQERMKAFALRPDRADVILPAALHLQMIMRLAQVRKLLIPHVGLRDGLIWSLSQGPKI